MGDRASYVGGVMKEVRYRVWDKKCRIYLDIVGAELGHKDTKFCGFKYIYCRPQDPNVEMKNPVPLYGGCVGFKLNDEVDSNRLVFEQDTGLKDKNDNSIWEGDIVSEHNGDIVGKISQHKSGEWQIKRIGVHGGASRLYGYRKLCEIVGNIHKDSGLLEEEE